jgi:hypothetical protein
MKPPKLHLTDLQLLRDFFAEGKELYLLDKNNSISGNVTAASFTKKDEVIDRDYPACIVEVHKSGFDIFLNTASDHQWVSFDYINNPDGSIRWFYGSNGEHAGHLDLYNAATTKAKLYKTITRLVWKAGYSRLLASGTFRVQQLLFETVQKSYGIDADEVVSFFTGTRGITRKMVMEVHKNHQSQGFIKVAFTEAAKLLIENEYNMVNTLNKYDFTSLSIPKISKRINGHARLSNIKPAVIIPADRITAIHIRALAELYALSREKKAVADTAAWQSILSNMDFLTKELVFINELDKESTRHLVQLLTKLFQVVPVGESVPVSVSHGDFTPWNMYCDEQRLYVYDWEMARNGMPMLFDLFHFTYQSLILQQRKGYAEVKDTINQWTIQPLVQQLVKKYRINLALHHALYLLFNVSHYLRQYLSEREPLMQSQWMMNAWTLAIEDYLESTQRTVGKS